MLVYYRLSDKNRRGKAPSYFTNENCLNNFLKNFNTNKDEIILICDNITDDTETWIKKYNLNYIKTNLGNSGSFDFCLNHAIKNLNDNDLVYFVENDYLHRQGSKDALMEAFYYCKADYVNLYDSPERYKKHFNINYQNEIDIQFDNFRNFKSDILYGMNNFWRSVNTATMTFASTVKILKEDHYVFKSALLSLTQENYPYRKIPGDYELFTTLVDVKKRLMISPIPGYCTHGDLLSPGIEWIKTL